MARRARHSFENNRRTTEVAGVIPQAEYRRNLTDRYLQRREERRVAELPPIIPERFTSRELGFQPGEGESPLPVSLFKEAILSSVAMNQVTIVTAETGAGKSTQIPQYLMECGYHVSMTQPRRIAASLVTERITEEVEDALEGELFHYDVRDLVGYRTAERNTTVPGRTRIEVVTDGLRLVQEFGERDELQDEVLIIDEVHEWNSNIEMLIARVRQLIAEKPDLRVVIMSATMEAEKLAKYFKQATGKMPPIIEVPGRSHEVKQIEQKNSTVVEQAIKYAKLNENILVFLPGVHEITNTINEINKRIQEEGLEDVVVLPLHSKLSQDEQDAVKYPRTKGIKIICATNIAQTSITIPDVNVVIDSGMERRVEIDDQGIQGLHLRLASRADMTQRAGRTGRVAPGTYVHTKLDDKTDFIPFASGDRQDYPTPEILRTNVNRNTLIAAAAGIDFRSLLLFHPVKKEIIQAAQIALQGLGALDENGVITPRGARMAKLPMRPEYSRMIIESEDENYPIGLRLQIAAMVAVMENGGLTSWVENASREWRDLSEEENSDFITQLDVFVKTKEYEPAQILDIGLDPRNMERSKELYGKIAYRLGIKRDMDKLQIPTAEEREVLVRTIATGLADNLYVRLSGKEYNAVDPSRDRYARGLSGRTTLDTFRLPQFLLGTPYRVEKRIKGQRTVEHVIQDATAITREALAAVALQHLSWHPDELKLRDNRLVRVQRQLFKGIVNLGITREVVAEQTPDATEFLLERILDEPGRAMKQLFRLKQTLETWQHRTMEPLNIMTQQEMEGIVISVIAQRPDFMELGDIDRRLQDVIDQGPYKLADRLPREKQLAIKAASPEKYGIYGETYSLEYRNGVPIVKLRDIELIKGWVKQPKLPDGREIKISYGYGKAKKTKTGEIQPSHGRTMYLKSWRRVTRKGDIIELNG